jgi:putative transposase
MILAHKIELKPSKTQLIGLKKAAGCARYTWNWALAEWNRQYEQGLKPKSMDLKKQWNREKPEWVYESPKDANQQPFMFIEKAWVRFFKRISDKPTFKKKGEHDSFYLSNDKFSVENNYIKIPHVGSVKMTEKLRFDGKIQSGTVSRQADRWFASISVEVLNYKKERISDNEVGIDLGITHAATLSTGEMFDAPKPLKNNLKKLKRLSRQHSKKQKGSKNRIKSAIRLSALHMRIGNIRKDFLHKLTTQLCHENQVIVIEDLNVQGMLSNHKLARAISDIGFYEFRRQLTYKKEIYGNSIVVADRWFPSSKLCRKCGLIKENFPLSERTFICECGHIEDRDINAANNLLTLGYRGINACGHGGSGSNLDLNETVVEETGISSEHLCSLRK